MTKGHYTKHPCVYIDKYNNPHLNIFRHFFIESDLPKYKKIMSENEKRDYDITINTRITDVGIDSKSSSEDYILPSWSRTGNSSPYNYERSMEDAAKKLKDEKLGFFKKLYRKISNMRKAKVEESFKKIKVSMVIPNTDDLSEALKGVEKLHTYFKDSGQYVMAEKVSVYGKILTNEIVLLKNNICKYLTEKDIIEFMLKTDRGVSITFLRYFSQILPISVGQKKIKVDELKIFDNYCVLYYDPEVEVFKFHEKEADRIAARDPILFGMIDGSDKLYYICDWVYQDDDLTMEKVESVINRKANLIEDAKINETNIRVKDAIKDMNTWIANFDNHNQSH